MPPHFRWNDGTLHAEQVPLERIAECFGTPFYCYSQAALSMAYWKFDAACRDFAPLICYAVKANSNLSVIRTFASLGAGADVVSGGELQRALAAGIPADKIVFSGVGKSRAEIDAAARAGIHQFNVESLPELEMLGAAGAALGRTLPVALRLNPDIDPATHAKIATGGKATKFGIGMAQLDAALAIIAAQPVLALKGIAVHIGSQIMDLAAFEAAFAFMAQQAATLRFMGHRIERVDLGGGLGIRYDYAAPPLMADYAALIRKYFDGSGVQIILEPGRRLVGEAGLLVSRVLQAKTGPDKNFLILDAGMNDLLRPALYDAWHNIMPVRLKPDAAGTDWDVVGPVCETGDLFGTNRSLPEPAPGDLVAIGCAGAYGASMSSTYNSRTLVPEFMVNGENFALIRRAVTAAEQMQWDVPPVWSC